MIDNVAVRQSAVYKVCASTDMISHDESVFAWLTWCCKLTMIAQTSHKLTLTNTATSRLPSRIAVLCTTSLDMKYNHTGLLTLYTVVCSST
jgi:hypothetical protein